MKIEIGDKNKIKNSNIGINKTVEKQSNKNKIIIEIITGIIITVAGGLILYYLTI